MKRNFCTLFDKNYIFRGLAMYYSLKKHSHDFCLWILCMDDIVYTQLLKMNLDSVELIKLSDLEDDELLKAKRGRTVAEYCWTLSSSLPLYIYKIKPELDRIAYLDSDLFFYSSSESIFEEMGESSIYIVRHNYSKELGYLESRSGIYNVSLVVFRNDQDAIMCLNWWRQRCLEWCFSRLEDGRFGDQMYLNDWPNRFNNVRIAKNKGINLAPWNVSKYLLKYINSDIYVDEDKLIFYHFHSFKMFEFNDYLLYQNFYLISRSEEKNIYLPYIESLNQLIKKFKSDFPDYKFGFDKGLSLRKKIIYLAKRKLFIFYYLKSLFNV